jgi:hypothetical protein
MAGRVASALLGRPLAAPSADGRDVAAGHRSAGIALVAMLMFAMFAPSFALVMAWSGPGQTNVLGAAGFVLIIGRSYSGRRRRCSAPSWVGCLLYRCALLATRSGGWPSVVP